MRLYRELRVITELVLQEHMLDKEVIYGYQKT